MGRYRRRNKKGEAALFGALFVFILIGLAFLLLAAVAQAAIYCFHAAIDFFSTPTGMLVITGSVLLFIISATLTVRKSAKQRRQREADEAAEQARMRSDDEKLRSAIEEIQVSVDRSDYIIDKNDYKRGNPKENLYRKNFLLTLFETFGNRCAKCGSNENGVDIDHFFFSKNAGGCFIMRHKNGHLVNNAIPLCQSCNRSKSDKSFRNFFTVEETLGLFQKNVLLTKLLNEKAVLQADGSVAKAKLRRNTA
jgi:5-methylcytosine-specific restriction endonuclease McrA